MGKIKVFYKEHRVFIILMAVGLVCMIIILAVLFAFFYGGDGKDKYGTRLENRSNYEISEERIEDLESFYIMDDKVLSAKAMITGRIIYIKINFAENVELIEAEGIAGKALQEKFSVEEQKYYDIHFTLEEAPSETNKGFLISGAQNKNGSGLVWNLNKEIEEETEV